MLQRHHLVGLGRGTTIAEQLVLAAEDVGDRRLLPTCQRVPTQAASSWHSGSADSTRRMRRTIRPGTSGRSRFSTAPACQNVGMRPQVVAHRGASHENAEHTLGAYIKALEQGAEALECDVRLTADGHLVCVHDRDLRRIASRKGRVSTMELADLNELDFAAWKNPWADLDDEAPDRDPDRDGVLTLRRLLETVAGVRPPVELAIETKHPTRYAGLVERKLVEMLKEFGWHEAGAPVRVMSFSYVALQRVRRLAPDAARGDARRARAPLAGAPPARRRRLDRRPGHRHPPQAPGVRAPAGRLRPRHARVDGQHRGRPAYLPRPRGPGRHHRPPRFVLDLLDGG